MREEQWKLVLEWGDRHPYLLQLAGSCLAETGDRDRAREEFDRQAAEVVPGQRAKQRWQKIKPLWWLFQSISAIGRLTVIGSKLS